MQGADAEESIVAALERIADRQEEFDAVVVIRGGGSRSDLGLLRLLLFCQQHSPFSAARSDRHWSRQRCQRGRHCRQPLTLKPLLP